MKAIQYIKANFFTLAVFAFVVGYVVYQRLPIWVDAFNIEGQPAPAFSLARLEPVLSEVERPDRMAELEEYRGRKVLLVFWATWCGVCREEIPALNQAAEEISSDRLVILGVTDEDPNTVKRFLENTPVRYPILIDIREQAFRAYRVRALPTLVWIDEDGQVEKLSVGDHPGLLYRLRYWAGGETQTQTTLAPHRS